MVFYGLNDEMKQIEDFKLFRRKTIVNLSSINKNGLSRSLKVGTNKAYIDR
jgi:hypothetical protein